MVCSQQYGDLIRFGKCYVLSAPWMVETHAKQTHCIKDKPLTWR